MIRVSTGHLNNLNTQEAPKMFYSADEIYGDEITSGVFPEYEGDGYDEYEGEDEYEGHVLTDEDMGDWRAYEE
jgi:hypothetical protein